jgi:F-type H+-transporting ATPase subunit alpha
VQNGYFDSVPVARVKEFQQRLTEYLQSSTSELLARLGTGEALDETVTADLRRACDAFAHMWK